ncbi:MAG: DUF3858 domain-containing protein, partial [Flavobacteriaceae bacterium]|nr:DUF3858 domain-containing protein [Flavobacteriaceae bacterium]
FIANFTDDRDVLVIKPDGGEIKHTKVYSRDDNNFIQKAHVAISVDGSIKADLKTTSRGLNYDNRQDITFESEKDQKLHYKDMYGYLNGVEISKLDFDKQHDKEEPVFIEKLQVNCAKYGKKAGSKLLFAPNLFNRVQSIPTAYENRKTPFEIQRSFIDEDEYLFSIPANMSIEALPDNIKVDKDFGSYEMTIEKIDDQNFKYKRILILNSGVYEKEKYKEYRSFIKTIVKKDKSKLVLTT